MLLALRASTDEADALRMFRGYIAAAEDGIRADAMAGFPSLAAAPEERQSYVFAATAARWLRCASKMTFEEGVAFIACELMKNTAQLSLGITGAVAEGFVKVFKPEPGQVDAALEELARGLALAVADLPSDRHEAAIKRVLLAARNIGAEPADQGNRGYL
jgi:hypothetical protein